MIYKVLHVSHCGGRSHLICWPWLSYVKFAQCAGVEKKSRAGSLRVTFSHHYAVLFRVPTWGLVTLLLSSYVTYQIVLLYVFQPGVISYRSFDRIVLAAICASSGRLKHGDDATRHESQNLARWDDHCYSCASKHGERVAGDAAWR